MIDVGSSRERVEICHVIVECRVINHHPEFLAMTFWTVELKLDFVCVRIISSQYFKLTNQP